MAADNDLGYLLTAYADGALAPEGVAWVEARLAENAELRARLAEIRRLRAGLAAALPAAPSTLAEPRVDALIGAAAAALRGRPRRRWWATLGVASVPVALVGVIAWLLLLPSQLARHAHAPLAVDKAGEATIDGLGSGVIADEEKHMSVARGSGRVASRRADPRREGKDERSASRAEAAHDNLKNQEPAMPPAAPSVAPATSPAPVEERPVKAARMKQMQKRMQMQEGDELELLDDDEGALDLAVGALARQAPARGVFGARRMTQAKEAAQEAQNGRFAYNGRTLSGKSSDSFSADMPANAIDRLARLQGGDDAGRSGADVPMIMALITEQAEGLEVEQLEQVEEAGKLGDVARAEDLVADEKRDRASWKQLRKDGDGRLAGETTRMNLETDEQPLAVVLQWLSAQAGIAIICDEPDQPRVQDALAGRDWRQILDSIARQHGLVVDRADPARWRLVRPAAATTPQAVAERLAQPAGPLPDAATLVAALRGGSGLPVNAADDAARSAAPRAQEVHGEVALGRVLVASALAAGLQLRPEGGALVLSTPAPLDPTSSFGLEPEAFRAAFGTRPMTATVDDPASTFAIDQDTASYDRAAAALEGGRHPDAFSIQVEHFVNAMPMDYPPAAGPEAFDVLAEAGPSPFAAGPYAARTHLVAIGVVARAVAPDERKPLRLTLAIDCSGSMAQPGGLDAVRAGLVDLVRGLRADDRVAVVAFADQARVVLPPTPGDEGERIVAALGALRAGGETNLAEGLDVAYRVAAEALAEGCENRVLVASDGAALDAEAAEAFAQRAQGWRRRGLSLVAVGCGAERAQTRVLETLADRADGQHWAVASAEQARELFATRLVPARLQLLARDAKVQVRFAPERVSHFRLLGWEERRLRHRDFRDDTVDAGELSQDSQVTALYEVVLAEGATGPLGEAAVRYHDTRRGAVRELACPLPGSLLAVAPSPRLELAACAAEFAEILGRGWWSNARCGTLARLRDRLARCAHPHAPRLLALVDRAIAVGVNP